MSPRLQHATINNCSTSGTQVCHRCHDPRHIFCHLADSTKINVVIDPETGASLEYRHLMKGATKGIWTTLFTNELGRLANGVGTLMPTGANALSLIPKTKVPKN